MIVACTFFSLFYLAPLLLLFLLYIFETYETNVRWKWTRTEKKKKRLNEMRKKNNLIWIRFIYKWFWHFNARCMRAGVFYALNWFSFFTCKTSKIKLYGRLFRNKFNAAFCDVICFDIIRISTEIVHWSFVAYVSTINAITFTKWLTNRISICMGCVCVCRGRNKSLILLIRPTGILR